MAKAVVIVDMLNDFVQENGCLPVPGAKEIAENIQKIKETAELHDLFVVYANDAHSKEDPEFQAWPPHCIKGTYGAKVIDQLVPKAPHLIIEKQTLSMWSKKEAAAYLRMLRIDELYITGVATEYCVRQAVLEAPKDFTINVVVDAISGVDIKKGDQCKALVEMGNHGARPKYTKEVLEEMVQ